MQNFNSVTHRSLWSSLVVVQTKQNFYKEKYVKPQKFVLQSAFPTSGMKHYFKLAVSLLPSNKAGWAYTF